MLFFKTIILIILIAALLCAIVYYCQLMKKLYHYLSFPGNITIHPERYIA